MKLIHTADWHLGNQMHDINRTEEYRHFFKWLKEKIIQEKAEVLVISGDVFDVANPSVEARKLYFDFLSVLDETECSNIVIIGGNHDSGNLLDAPKQILKKLNIHVVGSACNIQIEDMVFELKDNKLSSHLEEQGIKAQLVASITAYGKTYGVLRADMTHGRVWQNGDISLINTAARLIGVILANKNITLEDL